MKFLSVENGDTEDFFQFQAYPSRLRIIEVQFL